MTTVRAACCTCGPDCGPNLDDPDLLADDCWNCARCLHGCPAPYPLPCTCPEMTT